MVADLFIRGGEDRGGNRVWNPEDDLIDKGIEGVTHGDYTASPLSSPQLKKLYEAETDHNSRGTKYNKPNKMMGYFARIPSQL